MTKSIALFVGLAYLCSYGLALGIGLTGGADSPWLTPLGLTSMLVPSVCAVIVRRVERDRESIPGLRRFSLKYGLIAPFVPPLVATTMGFVCLEMLRDVTPAAWLSADAQGLLHPVRDARLGQEPFPATELARRVAMKLPVSLLLAGIFTTGEEVGWRGFLQPRLSRLYSPRRAALLTALVWAFWHTGFHIAGVGFPAHLKLLGVLFAGPALLIGLGTFNGWLFARSKSIWVVSLCHASANTWSQFPLQFVDVPGDVEGAVLSAIGAGFLLLGAIAYFVLKWPSPSTPATGEANA